MTRWLDNLSLRTKILGALLAIIVAGMAALGWDMMSMDAAHSKMAEIAAKSDQLITVQDIQSFTLQEDVDGKNILLTGDTSWLDEHAADRKETDGYIAGAVQNATDPQDQQALTDVINLRQAYETNWHQVLDAYQAGDITAATDAAFDENDTQLWDIQDKLDAVVIRGQDLIDTLFTEAAAQFQTAMMLSAAGIALFLVISAGSMTSSTWARCLSGAMTSGSWRGCSSG